MQIAILDQMSSRNAPSETQNGSTATDVFDIWEKLATGIPLQIFVKKMTKKKGRLSTRTHSKMKVLPLIDTGGGTPSPDPSPSLEATNVQRCR